MPKITRIVNQIQHPDRYSVFVDDKYSFALSANDLLAAGLHGGQEVTQEELNQIEQLAGSSKAYDQALNFLNLRQRSEKEVADYLKRKSIYADEVIAQTISRLRSNRFLDDAEFARAWIADRQNLKPRSKRQLEVELRQKGVSPQTIEIALLVSDQDSEIETAKQIAQKKLSRYPDQLKLIAYLMRQGFTYEVVKKALKELETKD